MAAIGIDFGTSFSCVAVTRGETVEVLAADAQGKRYLSSIVAFTKNESLIGERAKVQLEYEPENTIYDVKRLLGRAFHDVDVTEWPFKILEIDGKLNIEVTYRGETRFLLPEEIVAMLLRKMKKSAEQHLKRKVTVAAIGVPYHFNDDQRRAIIDAGRIADFITVELINETTAAALEFGLEETNGVRNVVIFDLGGGNFQASILKMTKDCITVIASTGTNKLGGDHFNEKLLKHFLGEFESKLEVTVTSSKAKARLRQKCESVKGDLSLETKGGIDKELSVFLSALDKNNDFDCKVTRKQFEEMNTENLQSISQALEHLIENATDMKKKDIDDVVLVGGATRIPSVFDTVSTYFGIKKIREMVNADEAVARGAAKYAALITKASFKPIRIEDVLPISAAIERMLNHQLEVPLKHIRYQVFAGHHQEKNTTICMKIGRHGVIDITANGDTEPTDLIPHKGNYDDMTIALKKSLADVERDKNLKWEKTLEYTSALQALISKLRKYIRRAKNLPDKKKTDVLGLCDETSVWIADDRSVSATGKNIHELDEIIKRKKYLESVLKYCKEEEERTKPPRDPSVGETVGKKKDELDYHGNALQISPAEQDDVVNKDAAAVLPREGNMRDNEGNNTQLPEAAQSEPFNQNPAATQTDQKQDILKHEDHEENQGDTDSNDGGESKLTSATDGKTSNMLPTNDLSEGGIGGQENLDDHRNVQKESAMKQGDANKDDTTGDDERNKPPSASVPGGNTPHADQPTGVDLSQKGADGNQGEVEDRENAPEESLKKQGDFANKNAVTVAPEGVSPTAAAENLSQQLPGVGNEYSETRADQVFGTEEQQEGSSLHTEDAGNVCNSTQQILQEGNQENIDTQNDEVVAPGGGDPADDADSASQIDIVESENEETHANQNDAAVAPGEGSTTHDTDNKSQPPNVENGNTGTHADETNNQPKEGECCQASKDVTESVEQPLPPQHSADDVWPGNENEEMEWQEDDTTGDDERNKPPSASVPGGNTPHADQPTGVDSSQKGADGNQGEVEDRENAPEESLKKQGDFANKNAVTVAPEGVSPTAAAENLSQQLPGVGNEYSETRADQVFGTEEQQEGSSLHTEDAGNVCNSTQQILQEGNQENIDTQNDEVVAPGEGGPADDADSASQLAIAESENEITHANQNDEAVALGGGSKTADTVNSSQPADVENEKAETHTDQTNNHPEEADSKNVTGGVDQPLPMDWEEGEDMMETDSIEDTNSDEQEPRAVETTESSCKEDDETQISLGDDEVQYRPVARNNVVNLCRIGINSEHPQNPEEAESDGSDL